MIRVILRESVSAGKRRRQRGEGQNSANVLHRLLLKSEIGRTKHWIPCGTQDVVPEAHELSLRMRCFAPIPTAVAAYPAGRDS
jgi:hypothetical protein